MLAKIRERRKVKGSRLKEEVCKGGWFQVSACTKENAELR
jgi:hypothetical protein